MTRTASPSPADAVTPDEAGRFAAAVQRLAPGEGKLGLAVSGGPDSMAMLLLAQAAMPGRFEVATVDHGLRAEAADECALVARICETLGAPCAVLQVQVGPGNILGEARTARYSALRDWAKMRDLRAVATAHHADDQAETILMRLNRGSGVAGLAGVRSIGFLDPPECELPLVRPVLDFRRAELAVIVARSGIAVVHDPSNRDEHYDRVRIRNALEEADWLDPPALANSAAHLAEAEDALQEFAIVLWSQLVRRDGEAIVFSPLAPNIMRLRIVRRIIGELGGKARGGDVARFVERLEVGESGNLGGVLAKVEGADWVFRPEPPRRS